jgi:hypothetical protein
VSRFLLDYPFADRLFPKALDVINHLRRWGRTVILQGGDVVFQPRKIERSGLFQSVESQVLVYIQRSSTSATCCATTCRDSASGRRTLEPDDSRLLVHTISKSPALIRYHHAM